MREGEMVYRQEKIPEFADVKKSSSKFNAELIFLFAYLDVEVGI